jgi:hypothetical protein
VHPWCARHGGAAAGVTDTIKPIRHRTAAMTPTGMERVAARGMLLALGMRDRQLALHPAELIQVGGSSPASDATDVVSPGKHAGPVPAPKLMLPRHPAAEDARR